MNEKEMIEDMQKVMEYTCNVYDEKGNHIRNKCNTWDCEYYCDTNGVCCSYSKKEATALYKAGYRKLPEGAVVLSKNEYEELNITGKYFNEALKQARNETAKAFAKKIKEKSSQCYIARNGEKISGITYTVSEKAIDEIAKQYGVEE